MKWQVDTVPNHLQFLTELSLKDYLQRRSIEPSAISNFLQIMAIYNPTKEIIILLTGDGQIEIDLLERLAITPAVCYDKLRQSWDKFQLGETTQRRS